MPASHSAEFFDQSREEVPAEVVKKAKFDIAQWPVFTNDAKIALEAIADTHYIRAPPIYDIPGQLVKPHMYFKRFRGALVVVHFNVTHYKWDTKNTFCMDLAHLHVLITPSPATPVTPRQKHAAVLGVDERYPIKQPNFKRARIDEEGNPSLVCILGTQANIYCSQRTKNDSDRSLFPKRRMFCNDRSLSSSSVARKVEKMCPRKIGRAHV